MQSFKQHRFPKGKLIRRQEAVLDELNEWRSFYRGRRADLLLTPELRQRLEERIDGVDEAWHRLLEASNWLAYIR
jgi:hypothetical protein